MPNELYLLVAFVLLALLVMVFWLNKKLSELKDQNKPDNTLLEWTKSTQSSIDNLNKTLNEALRSTNKDINQTLAQNTKALNDRLDKAAQVIGSVSREIGQMSEIGRSMKDLQEFLKSPKLRGEIGEEVLSDLIGQMFPKNNFFLQYGFRSGEKVDAAIKTEAGILPIDSKFPMENYQKSVKAESEEERKSAKKEFIRDVKKHIETIAKKYILPEEGTMDFALMYIPSESVFYEIVQETELTSFARKSRVYPVSPSTLYAHLQMILLSFEGKKLESKTREVFKLLRAISGDYEKVEGNLSVLGKHVNNAYAQMGNVSNSFMSLGQKISATKHLGEEAEEKLTDSGETKQLEI
ncbi:MAG: DNA recombination protein RmuC [Patescibacteria group bacterium]|nr:DNA recombination protein RmuC [Patescibacteria group bacterium]